MTTWKDKSQPPGHTLGAQPAKALPVSRDPGTTPGTPFGGIPPDPIRGEILVHIETTPEIRAKIESVTRHSGPFDLSADFQRGGTTRDIEKI